MPYDLRAPVAEAGQGLACQAIQISRSACTPGPDSRRMHSPKAASVLAPSFLLHHLHNDPSGACACSRPVYTVWQRGFVA